MQNKTQFEDSEDCGKQAKDNNNRDCVVFCDNGSLKLSDSKVKIIVGKN